MSVFPSVIPSQTLLTFCFGTNEAGSGTVKEIEDAGNSHTDIRVARVEVQGSESLKLELEEFFWGNFEVGDLKG